MTNTAIPAVAESARVVTETQTAAILGVHVQTLRRWRRERAGPPALLLGRRRFGYRLSDLRVWQDQRLIA